MEVNAANTQILIDNLCIEGHKSRGEYIELMQRRINDLENFVTKLVAERGVRDSDSLHDLLLPEEDQDDALIADAMRLMSNE